MTTTVAPRSTREGSAATGLYDGSAVRAMFDRMSTSYERMNVIMSLGFSVHWRRQLLDLVPDVGRAPRVLDAMTGMGETWGQLLRRFPDGELTAVDFAPAMIAHARERNRDRFGERVDVRCGDMLDSGLGTASFDLVVSAYGLKTFDESQTTRLIDELARVLRPGGRYAFVELTEPPNRLLRRLYGLYLRVIVPVAGMLCLSDSEEYRMLHRYVRGYATGSRTAHALRAHPELTVETRRHFFGCATSFSGARRG